MTKHAVLSASGAPGWMRCHGKLAMEKPFPETSSKYADEGTAAHEVAAMCLQQGQDASAFAGRVITVARGEGAQRTERQFEVNEEMVEAVQDYVDIVRGLGGDLMVEQLVDFSRWIGVPDSFGTSDALVVLDNELVVVDLKYGKGVAVHAKDNEQLMLYALGCYDIASLAYEIETVRLMIAQPRVNHVSEWTLPVADLFEFAKDAEVSARHAKYQYDGHAKPSLNPGETQCRWCKAKAVCPAAAKLVWSTVHDGSGPAEPGDFEDLTVDAPQDLAQIADDGLAARMAQVDFIERWCAAVRAEVERRLIEGVEVPGYKLVQGKRGARAWADAQAAEEALKTMRLKQEEMYDMKLISPTTAEKLSKAGTLGPRQWKKLSELIVQSEGKPSVAPADDKRPAITVNVTADDFADVSDDGGDLA